MDDHGLRRAHDDARERTRVDVAELNGGAHPLGCAFRFFPAEPVGGEGETPALEHHVADLGNGVLQGGGDDGEIVRIGGEQAQGFGGGCRFAHQIPSTGSAVTRRTSAPHARSFSSNPSKPRSR